MKRLTVLVHGFVYDAIFGNGGDETRRPYLDRETACARLWREALGSFGPSDALAIIPIPGPTRGAAAEYSAHAQDRLGDRCVLLDGTVPPLAGPPADPRSNREERETTAHAEACARQLRHLLGDRGYSTDLRGVSAEGWGASFDGCVTKYTLNIRRALGLERAIDIPFDMTVPDAKFLLAARCRETVTLSAGLRVFLFECGDGPCALFVSASEAPGSPPVRVCIQGGAAPLEVRSKQGIRLWPDPEPYELRGVPPEYRENPQTVVMKRGSDLLVPVSAGYVYRLAKAPAYVFAGPGLPFDEFRRLVCEASTIEPG